MKILEIATDLRLGGVQKFVLDLCQELGKKHEVVLVTTWSDSIDELSVSKPKFRRISLGKTSGGLSLLLMLKLFFLILKEKPDVVHTHLYALIYALPNVFLSLPWKTKFIHTIHSMADKEMPSMKKVTGRIYGKKILPVAISEQVKESAKDFYGGLETSLIFNGSAIECDDVADAEAKKVLSGVRRTPKTKIFVNVANVSENKNQKLLNEAARRLEADNYDFKVVILGREDDKKYSEELQKNFCSSVEYLGAVKHPCSYLRNSDFFTLASIYEGMPISLIEALSCGCVPVCTPAGGIPCGCIDGETGILAEDFSVDAMYYAMKEAMTMSEEKYFSFSKRCKELFEARFSMVKCASEYEKLFHSEKNL